MKPTVFDVAQYVLRKNGPMTTMKLQKLIYYAQAWALAWSEHPLFDNTMEAWDRGPVVREYGMPIVALARSMCSQFGDPTHLDADQRDTVDVVLSRYGNLSPEVLSELTHAESPWRNAHSQSNTTAISLGDLQSYYRQLGMALLEEMTSDSPTDLFSLKLLLMQITVQNCQEPIGWGVPMGHEVW